MDFKILKFDGPLGPRVVDCRLWRQVKRGAADAAGCVEGLCFRGLEKGSKRKVDARYAGEGYGLLTQAGCVR